MSCTVRCNCQISWFSDIIPAEQLAMWTYWVIALQLSIKRVARIWHFPERKQTPSDVAVPCGGHNATVPLCCANVIMCSYQFWVGRGVMSCRYYGFRKTYFQKFWGRKKGTANDFCGAFFVQRKILLDSKTLHPYEEVLHGKLVYSVRVWQVAVSSHEVDMKWKGLQKCRNPEGPERASTISHQIVLPHNVDEMEWDFILSKNRKLFPPLSHQTKCTTLHSLRISTVFSRVQRILL